MHGEKGMLQECSSQRIYPGVVPLNKSLELYGEKEMILVNKDNVFQITMLFLISHKIFTFISNNDLTQFPYGGTQQVSNNGN